MRKDELTHYGVLGMKWGVRRSFRSAERMFNKSAKKGQPISLTEKEGETRSTRNKRLALSSVMGRRDKDRINAKVSKGMSEQDAIKQEFALKKAAGKIAVSNYLLAMGARSFAESRRK